ncbi:MAG: hypothetical protein MZV49_15570 [Rhodopseudomonas palustris]|nr:hypothetical protein [Rhodopseudomonas palustris]
MSQALPWVEQKTGLALTEEQRQAVRLAFQEKLLVITGGPGHREDDDPPGRHPTAGGESGSGCTSPRPPGRAAKRLAEVTGHDAEHTPPAPGVESRARAVSSGTPGILWRPISWSWMRSSMIDVMLAHHLRAGDSPHGDAPPGWRRGSACRRSVPGPSCGTSLACPGCPGRPPDDDLPAGGAEPDRRKRASGEPRRVPGPVR